MDRDSTIMIYGAIMGVVVGGVLAYQTGDPILNLSFMAMWSYLFTNCMRALPEKMSIR